MRTLDTRAVRFGELAGPLVHDSVFFDWQLISTQEFAAAIGYPFEQLIAADEIPYAPVFVQTHIDRYPSVGDCIAVETTPLQIGEHRIVLRYEFLDGTGKPFGVSRIIHVTINPDGSAKPLPGTVRRRAKEDVIEGIEDSDLKLDVDHSADADPTYSDSFEIRRPLIEGSELAYFEEYPRFATIALERFLEGQGVSVLETDNNRHPFRLQRWEWNFNAPVSYGTILDVNATVVNRSNESIIVAHTFEQEGNILIEGLTEYGCFDENGEPVPFAECILEAMSVD